MHDVSWKSECNHRIHEQRSGYGNEDFNTEIYAREIYRDNPMTEEELLKKHEAITKLIQDYSLGVQNVYSEIEKVRKQLDLMKGLQARSEEETLPIDEVQLTLRIKSYPMNIRVHMQVETNFGEITYAYDWPPFREDKLGEGINKAYYTILNELYDAHEERGGHFIGDEGCKEWMDKNGKTIIKKEPSFSPRFSK